MTITEFLEARIVEDAEEAEWYGNTEYFEGGWTKAHTGRVLRECAAKRAIIQEWQPAPVGGWGVHADGVDVGNWEATDNAVRHLAAVYSDHPDYQQEWAL